MTTLDEILTGMPGPQEVATDQLRAGAARNPVLVVLDDDPTGTQSVADLPVLCAWDVDSLAWALAEGAPAVYVMTNSRSLSAADAEQRNREVARNAYAAADRAGVDVTFVSRSDSTMRGHYPLEPTVLAGEMAAHGSPVDGVVVVPAFPDAGRITANGVHHVKVGDEYVRAGDSEFAHDATFGYRSSDLREWVEEKTGGDVAAGDVALIDLRMLRTDPDATVRCLRSLTDGRPVVADVVEEADLRLLAAAMHRAQEEGARFVIRCGPPFPRSYIGQEPRSPLTGADVDRIRAGGLAEDAVGGLVVVGSHVALTTSQLTHLEERDHPLTFEIDVPTVVGYGGEAHVAELAERVAAELATRNVVVRTSRTLMRTDDPDESLALSRSVSAAVVSLVQQVLARRAPRFVVAKGGITSSDVAAHGLSIRRAYVRGPMLPGIVSLWEPVDGPAKGIPYIVFAGNVGGPQSLAEVVDKLSDDAPTTPEEKA